MGKISRAQRYKKVTNNEQEELKICDFLTRKTIYIAPDIQNIAVLMCVRGMSVSDEIPPVTIKRIVRIMKYVLTESVAVS